ncbi:acyl carrier protein [Clostridium sp. PL3]|uniref:Acyl carrier protein n=1 Tax=Clostridium thailandense TaxID=2794346 RepID=A0A949TMU2_9CLOT|nr:acyl carrier protein [Clostridium thailandense]MBV7273347.1 acyl carrier protein [Clostridium thailandense]
MTNLEKLNTVICDTLGIKKVENIKDEMGPDEIEDWDSLAHVELVNGLEEKFKISLDVVDISRMYTIGDIKKILKKYGVEI